MPLVFRKARKTLGQPGTRQCIKHGEAIALEPGITAFPKWRRTGQRKKVRQEIRHLVHQVDTQLVVFDADMHVHTANQEPPGGALHLNRQLVIALLARVFLVLPVAERVRRRCDRFQAVPVRDFLDVATQVHKLFTNFRNVLADLGTDLNLRAKQFG